MTDEQKNKLVNLGALESFGTKLLSKIASEYLTGEAADGVYASISGVAGQFAVGTLRLSNAVTVSHTTVSDVPYVRFSSGNNYVDLPISSGSTTFATQAQLNGKANMVTVSGNSQFVTTPTVNVISAIYVNTLSGRAFSTTDRYSDGDILFIKGYTSPNIEGLYRVVNSSTNVNSGTTAADIEFVCNASPYTLYYCAADDKIKRYTPVLGMTSVVEQSATIVIDEESYEPATDADILALLQELGLSDGTDSDDDNDNDNNEEEE